MKISKGICIALLLMLGFFSFSCGEIKIANDDPGSSVVVEKEIVDRHHSPGCTDTTCPGGAYCKPTPVPSQALPKASISENKVISLPTDYATLSGSASSEGQIVSYLWEKFSGPSEPVIESPTNTFTRVSNLKPGVYAFLFTAKDNLGQVAHALKTVTVILPDQEIPSQDPPQVSAGDNREISLPTNYVTLTGSASSKGSIASYLWSKYSGPGNSTIVTPTSASTQVTGLQPGVHTFFFTATDNLGQSSYAFLAVIVNSGQVSVSAGADKTIYFPASSVTLTGNASTANGHIKSFLWEKISGPGSPTIAVPSSASTQVTGLQVGTYVFRLTATDDFDFSSSDEVTVTLLPYGSQELFHTNTTSIFIVPDSVAELYITACGGGEGGCTFSGGGGGEAILRQKFPVTSGQSIEIYVGKGGLGLATYNRYKGESTIIGSLITLKGGDLFNNIPSGGAGGVTGSGAGIPAPNDRNAPGRPGQPGLIGQGGQPGSSGNATGNGGGGSLGGGGGGGGSFNGSGGLGGASIFGKGGNGNISYTVNGENGYGITGGSGGKYNQASPGGAGGGGSYGGGGGSGHAGTISNPEPTSGGSGGNGYVLIEWGELPPLESLTFK